ncbi:AAA family ATPase [Burkholderia sp. LMU1-1-1.1]|uniref:AAA family ATPase n=1 Tax=Burkholderia sp. LMU1-1-1.1 TaxID=3135266 RepID=UPI003437D0F8
MDKDSRKYMPQTQQKLHFAKIKKLKNLVELDEIRFDEKPLTAILGPNGCGKSTILHALACSYRPLDGGTQPNHKFTHWFTANTDANWAGSEFSLEHSYRDAELATHTQRYRKDGDRWAPKYERRPQRHVALIGIASCVPKIEEERYTSIIRYNTNHHADDASIVIRRHMSTIFNRSYDELNTHQAGRKRYNGLAHGGTRYSSLSMGAGEQRVLNLLTQVFGSPRYGLVLIDEIDLLLHTEALKNLIAILAVRAADKSLQIIFTTHREVVLEMNDRVSIKHLFQAPHRTLCFSDTKPDALRRLTGHQLRPLEIFVEDPVATAIVEYELSALGMKRHTSVTTYGAAINLFTVAAGLSLTGMNEFPNTLFLQDGDVYVSEEERKARLDAVLTGTEPATVVRKHVISAAIAKFTAADFASPEVCLHRMIIGLNPEQNETAREIILISRGIVAVADNHSFTHQVIEILDMGEQAGNAKIVATAALSDQWAIYTGELRAWLQARRADVLEAH